jgi:2-polyprenyl-6-methoxyphenol hydroxylase-like FAD-dependent oxidoreductase
MVKTDIFVVGGGPAGLAAAIALRRKGFSVTVADGIFPPADKACGEGLMPDAIAALSNLGVSIGAADSFPFWGIRFLDRGTAVDAKFPVGCARGVRRTTLHRMMIEQADAVGVQLRWGAKVDLSTLTCGWIIGADGENSLVRKWAGLDVRLRDRRRFGFRRHYRIEPWTDRMELYWGRTCQVYVTPITPESVCVAAISRDSQLRLDEALRQFPDLERKLQPSATISTERGAVTSSRKLKTVYRERVALVGRRALPRIPSGHRVGRSNRVGRFGQVSGEASPNRSASRVDGETAGNDR